MNFQSLTKVEDAQFYLDLAFRNSNTAVGKSREHVNSKDKIYKSRMVELDRVSSIKKTLTNLLENILKSFPSLDTLPKFYLELVKCTLEYSELKKSLGAVNWAKNSVMKFFSIYKSRIAKCRDIAKINSYRREFNGRVSSVLNQIDKQLSFLESARRVMKNYPTIKTGVYTIAITGFPNVGKTTLLYKLTGSKPEIKDYAFTTKDINVGYFMNGKDKVQVLDTPGTLNRFDKMNNIEKKAYLAMKYCANMIIYVFDITEPYPLQEQIELYEKIKEYGVPVFVYLSKKDILDKETIGKFKISNLSPEEIKERLQQQ